ncbi:MAG: hypothetical protein WBP39_08060, partial [Candidatus Phosphoribacter baldrii]
RRVNGSERRACRLRTGMPHLRGECDLGEWVPEERQRCSSVRHTASAWAALAHLRVLSEAAGVRVC